MPFRLGIRKEAEKMINAIGDIVYPVLMSLCFPLFLYQFVLEKEERLIQNMKINGLKMKNYWLVNMCFNYAVYLTAALSYIYFGKYVSGLSFFTESNWSIMVAAILGWGITQVAYSLLF